MTRAADALGILAGHAEVGAEDWDLSAHVMAVSDLTRNECQTEIDQAAQDRNRARAVARADAQLVTEETVVDKAKRRILAKLTDDWIAAKPIRSALTRSLRGSFEEAVAQLVDEQQVEIVAVEVNGQEGMKLRLRGDTAPPLSPPVTTGRDAGDTRHPIQRYYLPGEALAAHRGGAA